MKQLKVILTDDTIIDYKSYDDIEKSMREASRISIEGFYIEENNIYIYYPLTRIKQIEIH